MPVTRYVSMNGRLRGEITAGSRTDYVTDALGSVTGTVNSSSTIVNTYRYKPYGQQLAKTGTGSDPRYLWTGDTGARRTNLNRAEQYNIYRHYSTQHACWNSVDPLYHMLRLESRLRGMLPPYAYVRCRVVNLIDPLGLAETAPGTTGTLPGQDSSTIKGCVEFNLPLGAVFAVVGRYCVRCFDSSCCKTQPVAEKCYELNAGLSLSPGIRWTDFLHIDNLKSELEAAYILLSSLVGGAASAALSCSHPLPDCPAPSDRVDVEVCVEACFGFASLIGCFGTKGGHWGFETGFCGIPSLTVTGLAIREWCI